MSEANGERRARWAWRVVFFWMAVLFGARIALDPLAINADSAMYLECGRQLLQGHVPYVDFLDLNPPLIMYLSVLPNLLGRALGISSITAFNLLVTGLVGWSAWRFHKLLSRARLAAEWMTLGALAASLLALYLRHDLNVTGNRPFGQREHLMVLLYLPLFALRLARFHGAELETREILGAGIAAGIGVALKPHFLLLLLLPEGVWCIRRRGLRLDPERFLVVAGTLLVYGAHFLLVPAAMRESYFHRLAPLVWSGYQAFHVSPRELWEHGAPWVLLSLAALGVAAIRRRAAPLMPLAAFTVAGLALYFGQQKGWTYHLIPAWTGALVILGAAASEVRGLWGDGVRALVVGGLVIATVRLGRNQPSVVEIMDRQVTREIEAHSAPGDPVAFLSTAPWPGFPALVRAGRTPATRALWLFEIPMFYRASAPEEEARMLRELREDLVRRRPALIAVSRGTCFACPGGLELLDYFRRHDLRLDGYHLLSEAGPFAWFARD